MERAALQHRSFNRWMSLHYLDTQNIISNKSSLVPFSPWPSTTLYASTFPSLKSLVLLWLLVYGFSNDKQGIHDHKEVRMYSKQRVSNSQPWIPNVTHWHICILTQRQQGSWRRQLIKLSDYSDQFQGICCYAKWFTKLSSSLQFCTVKGNLSGWEGEGFQPWTRQSPKRAWDSSSAKDAMCCFWNPADSRGSFSQKGKLLASSTLLLMNNNHQVAKKQAANWKWIEACSQADCLPLPGVNHRSYFTRYARAFIGNYNYCISSNKLAISATHKHLNVTYDNELVCYSRHLKNWSLLSDNQVLSAITQITNRHMAWYNAL